jgi:N-acetyl-anhydromuramyl-L-alanine amidase AmpD
MQHDDVTRGELVHHYTVEANGNSSPHLSTLKQYIMSIHYLVVANPVTKSDLVLDDMFNPTMLESKLQRPEHCDK